jgi:hypothetical protein
MGRWSKQGSRDTSEQVTFCTIALRNTNTSPTRACSGGGDSGAREEEEEGYVKQVPSCGSWRATCADTRLDTNEGDTNEVGNNQDTRTRGLTPPDEQVKNIRLARTESTTQLQQKEAW